MTDTPRRFTADYLAKAAKCAVFACNDDTVAAEISAMLQHAADLAREREQRFQLGQDWVSGVTNAKGEDVSVVGPMPSALPGQSAALIARVREAGRRGYEWAEVEASADEAATIQLEATDIQEVANRLERAEALLAQVRAWAERGPNEDAIRHLYTDIGLRNKFTERELAIAVKCSRQMMQDLKTELLALLTAQGQTGAGR